MRVKVVPPTFALIGAACLAAAAPAVSKPPPPAPRIGIDTTFGDHAHEAYRLFGLKHYRDAINTINLALAMRPDDKNASLLYALRGHCHWDLDEDQLALADYTEAIRRDAGVQGVHGRKGILECNHGNLGAGIVDLTAALRERQKDAAYFLHARAEALVRQGKPAEAQKDFESVIQLPPIGAQGYCDRAESFARLGDADRARRDFRTARRIDSSNPVPYNELAWFEATMPDANFRDGKAAVRDATEACRLTSWKDPDTLDTLAAAYAELGEYNQALNYERPAVDLETSPAARKVLQAHLALFEKHEPVREMLPPK